MPITVLGGAGTLDSDMGKLINQYKVIGVAAKLKYLKENLELF